MVVASDRLLNLRQEKSRGFQEGYWPALVDDFRTLIAAQGQQAAFDPSNFLPCWQFTAATHLSVRLARLRFSAFLMQTLRISPGASFWSGQTSKSPKTAYSSAI